MSFTPVSAVGIGNGTKKTAGAASGQGLGAPVASSGAPQGAGNGSPVAAEPPAAPIPVSVS